MKKQLATFLLLALAPVAFAQTTFTNGVKGSALPSASTPLTGAESVLLIQSGATKTATVLQITAAATSQNLATSNALVAAVTVQAGANTGTSNTLSAQIAAQVSALNTASNALNTASNALAAAASAASAKDTATSNALAAAASAAIAANTATSNSIAGAAAAAAASALAGYSGSGVTNGATAQLAAVDYSVASLGSITNSGSLNVSLALSAMQTLNVSSTSSSTATLTLSLTNIIAGQNVNVLISRTDSHPSWTYDVVLPSGTINLNSGAATTVAIPGGKSLLLNFTCIGSSLAQTIMSASLSQ